MAKKIQTTVKKKPTKKAATTKVAKTSKKIDKKDTTKEKKYANDIFAFMKSVIGNDSEFNAMSNVYKSKFTFMFNRFCSIRFPLPAAILSRIGINSAEVVNYWQFILTKKGERGVPSWIFSALKNTKSKKSDIEIKKTKEYYPEAKTIQEYCKLYRIDDKVFDETMNLYKQEFLVELKTFETMLKGKK